MVTDVTPASTSAMITPRSRSRVATAVGAAWTAVMGILPHVLHHVGPLAGAAIVAGTTGTILFGLAAFVFTVPLLRRVHRRCGSWRLPGILLAVFVSVWLVSTFVAGPWVRDQLTDEPASTQPARESGLGAGEDDEEHDEHHEPGDPP